MLLVSVESPETSLSRVNVTSNCSPVGAEFSHSLPLYYTVQISLCVSCSGGTGDIIKSVQWTQHVPNTDSPSVFRIKLARLLTLGSCGFSLSTGHFLIPALHLHLSLPRGFVCRFYFWLYRPSQSTREAIKSQSNAQWSSPRSHSLTVSSLHDVIGSMLGALLQSLFQFPALLADFYLSGLQEEGKVDPDLESDDDEWHSFAQVQVRVPLRPANSAALSDPTKSRDPSLLLPPTPPYLKE